MNFASADGRLLPWTGDARRAYGGRLLARRLWWATSDQAQQRASGLVGVSRIVKWESEGVGDHPCLPLIGLLEIGERVESAVPPRRPASGA